MNRTDSGKIRILAGASRRNVVLWGILTLVISGMMAITAMDLWGADWNVPVSGYRSDSIGMLLETQNFLRGGNMHSPAVYNAPDLHSYRGLLADFTLILPVNALLAVITGSVEAGLNLHAVIAYVMLAGCMYVVCVKLKLNPLVSMISAVLYPFASFFVLGANTLLIAYIICFYIPPFCYCILGIVSGGEDTGKSGHPLWLRLLAYSFVFFCVGIYSAYYAFFALLILAFAGAYALFVLKSVDKILLAALGFINIAFGIAVYTMPDILSRMGMAWLWESGMYYPCCVLVAAVLAFLVFVFLKKIYPKLNIRRVYACLAVFAVFAVAAYGVLKYYTDFLGEYDGRSLMAVEAGSFKVVHAVLPVFANVFGPVNEALEQFAVVEQDDYFTLGVLSGTGFIYSIIKLFPSCKAQDAKTKLARACGLCNAFIVLLGMKGGISSIIAAAVTTGIRNYNRICVYLAVFSLIAFAVLLEKILARIQTAAGTVRRRAAYGVLSLAMVIGILLSVSVSHVYYDVFDIASYELRKAEHDAWHDYIGRVEAEVPEGGMIFELPKDVDDAYTAELMTKGRLYELSIPAIVSTHTVWSYAGGWKPDTTLGEDAQGYLEQVKEKGFCGIYLDALLYHDDSYKDQTEILSEYLGEPLVCSEGRRFFYRLE